MNQQRGFTLLEMML
ncbi:TPA: prepilin-type N-terminal cleavage/methylation domain-containing protein, partial [Escherichia coli]|nr:prepilin-type N-terminal cleavage/methylation domain-containing protein [Escherichia coli]